MVWYFFLAGTGGGAYLTATSIDLWSGRSGDGRGRHLKPLTDAGVLLGFFMVLLGAVLLLTDLGRIDRAYLLFTRPTFTPLSVGAWAILFFAICVFYLLGVSHLGFWEPSPAFTTGAKVAGMVFSVTIIVYAGVLFADTRAVTFWSSPLVAALFVLSALSSGMGLLMAWAFFLDTGRVMAETLVTLSRIDAVIIGLEAVATVLLIVTMTTRAPVSVGLIMSGGLAGVFWLGFVFCGLLAPVVAELGLSRRFTPSLCALAGVLLLIGGFSLRYVVANAGVHDAIVQLSTTVPRCG